MKKASLILNAVLVIAVAVLYYLHFSACSASCGNTAANDSTAIEKQVVLTPTDIKESKIVYVNSDILNEEYDFVKDLVAAARSKQEKLESAYEAKAKKFQEDYTALQEKASQGLLSENQANAAQTDLIKRKEELDKMELQLQSMMEEIQKSNEEVRKNVIDYINEYNKTGQYNFILTYTDTPGGFLLLANDSLDITKDIVAGLNAQYKAKKEAKKK